MILNVIYSDIFHYMFCMLINFNISEGLYLFMIFLQSKRTKFKHEAFASFFKVQLKCFQQKSLSGDVILAELYQEKKLKLKLAKASYDETHISAVTELEAMRCPIVIEALRNFNN